MKNALPYWVSTKLNTAKNFAKAAVFSVAIASSMQAVASQTSDCLNRVHPASQKEKAQFPHIAKSIDLVGRQTVCEFMIKNDIQKWDEATFTDIILSVQQNYNQNSANPIKEDGILGPRTLEIIGNDMKVARDAEIFSTMRTLTDKQITETKNSFDNFNREIQSDLVELAHRDGGDYVPQNLRWDTILVLATMVRELKGKNPNNEIDTKTLESLMISLN